MPRRNRRNHYPDFRSDEWRSAGTDLHPARRQGDHKPDPFTARTPKQRAAWTALDRNLLVFLLGPAGTGKTLLAAARAVEDYLAFGSRIVAARPVVEAGESIGYLKGGLVEKMGPWLRPVTECLQKRLGPDANLTSIFEMTSFTYLRGRTFNDATLILDEVQNASPAQLKLALTRAGERCRVIVTGVPRPMRPGSRPAIRLGGSPPFQGAPRGWLLRVRGGRCLPVRSGPDGPGGLRGG